MPEDSPSQLASLSPQVDRFFRSARSAVAAYLSSFARQADASFLELRASLDLARDEIKRHERRHAGRFNVFDFIEPDENRLSDIIAHLLDSQGVHGQGSEFLRLFADRIGIEVPTGTRIAVHREMATAYIANPLRRIDIVLDFGTFGIAIENKPWAGEQIDQVSDYLRHLCRRFGDRFVLVYASGDGSPPPSVAPDELGRLTKQGRFRVIDFANGVAGWIGACADVCEAEPVRWFLRAFQAYLSAGFSTSELHKGDAP